MSTEEYFQVLETVPEDDDEWAEEDDSDLQMLLKEAGEGKIIALEELKRELEI